MHISGAPFDISLKWRNTLNAVIFRYFGIFSFDSFFFFEKKFGEKKNLSQKIIFYRFIQISMKLNEYGESTNLQLFGVATARERDFLCYPKKIIVYNSIENFKNYKI